MTLHVTLRKFQFSLTVKKVATKLRIVSKEGKDKKSQSLKEVVTKALTIDDSLIEHSLLLLVTL